MVTPRRAPTPGSRRRLARAVETPAGVPVAALRRLRPGLRAARGARGRFKAGSLWRRGRPGGVAEGRRRGPGGPRSQTALRRRFLWRAGGERRAGAAAGAVAGPGERVCRAARGPEAQRTRGSRPWGRGSGPMLGRRPTWAEGCCRGGAGSCDGLCFPREPEAGPQLEASRRCWRCEEAGWTGQPESRGPLATGS